MSGTDMRVADRVAIQECLNRYARGIDRRNWAFLASAFHPGAKIDQGDFKGTIEEMLESVAARHAVIEQSAHLLTNTTIEFDSEDGAVVETYFLACLRNAHVPPPMRAAMDTPAEGKIDMRSLGRYIDRFERRIGAWRIARRVCVAETLTGVAASEAATLSPNWVMSSRDPDDALWKMREDVGLKGPVG